jgi:hypothetical protein
MPPADSQLRALLQGAQARSWLAQWRLVRPMTIDESGRVLRADLLTGVLRRPNQPFDLPLEDRGPIRATSI